jgi:hypothetical protein
MKCRTALCLAVAMIALCLLTSCLGRSESERGAVSGVIAGQPVAVTWTRDSEGRTTLEIPPALLNAAGAAANATPWGALLTGGASAVAAAAAAYARAQSQRASEHKSDAAEGWAEALKTKKDPNA